MAIMQKNYLTIVILIVLTNIISLSTHVLILQLFDPPIPTSEPYAGEIAVVGFLIRYLIVAGSTLIYFLSREYWENMRLSYRVILFALLSMALVEQLFRSPIMGIAVGIPWMYQALTTVPIYVSYIVLSLFIFLLMPIVLKQKEWKFLNCIIFTILTTVAIFFIKKWVQNLLEPLLNHVPQMSEADGIQPPYGMNILIPAYITFLECTVACFILFYLIKDKLERFNTLTKGILMGGILIAIHGGIFSIVTILNSEGNIFYRIFYNGQFLWEYLSLGILTAYSFAFLKKSDVRNF